MSPPAPTIVTNIATQFIGVGLTIVGLGFTIAQPVIARLDLLTTSVARMEVQMTAASTTIAAQDAKIRTLEAQQNNSREAIIRLRGSLSEQGIPTQ